MGIDNYIWAEAETTFVLLGVLIAVLIWGFFQRHPTE